MRARAGTIDLVLLGVLWGSIGVIVKDVRVPSPAIAMFRMGIGCLAVLAVHAAAILLVFVGPVFVAAAVGPVLGERVERRTIAALAVSLGGMALIAAPAWRVQDAAGVAYALASAVAFACVMLAGKRLTEVYQPPAILAWQLGVGAVAVAPVAVAAGFDGLDSSLPSLLMLGLVHTAIAGFFYFRALTVVKAQHVGVLTYLEPATAMLYAWVFLSETPSAATLAGGALIMAAGLSIVATRAPVAVSPSEPVAQPPGTGASLQP